MLGPQYVNPAVVRPARNHLDSIDPQRRHPPAQHVANQHAPDLAVRFPRPLEFARDLRHQLQLQLDRKPRVFRTPSHIERRLLGSGSHRRHDFIVTRFNATLLYACLLCIWSQPPSETWKTSRFARFASCATKWT